MTKQLDNNKIAILKKQGCLNPFPQKVQDRLFQDITFFDPYDIVQVKYELLRRVLVENDSISNASKSFGFSRLSFYRILLTFNTFGLAGLIAQKRGPKNAHKLTGDVMEFVKKIMIENPSSKSIELKKAIEKEFGLLVHTRSIERSLLKKKMKK